MAIKMRVLYNSKKKGMEQLAQAIRAEYELPVNAVDGKIPPAYPCDKERIVIVGVSAKGAVPDNVRLFCGGLDKSRATNVAVLVDGSQDAADALAKVVTSAGTNLVGTKVISFGGFGPFGGGLTDEIKTDVSAWIKDMIANCK